MCSSSSSSFLLTHFENLGAENLPSNVISFSFSLSLLPYYERRERERKAPSFRERKHAEERGDMKERCKDDREKEEGSLILLIFLKFLSLFSLLQTRKSTERTTI